MSERYKLDGSDAIAPVPFDALEQVVRGSHSHVAIPVEDHSIEAHKNSGYKAAEYEHQDYPKAVAHDEVTGDPILVNSFEEEAAYHEQKAEE